MYINFQQNLVNRSVIIVHTNLFAKNRKLHKLATTNSNFHKIDSFRYYRKTYMYINFQQNRVRRSVKTVHTNLYLQKLANCITNCIHLQLAIRISKNHAFGTCTTP